MDTNNNIMSEEVRLRLIVEGDIQAVGYRALVKHIARSLQIKGSVKNLPDGTVEILCEGGKENIAVFKKRLTYNQKTAVACLV